MLLRHCPLQALQKHISNSFHSTGRPFAFKQLRYSLLGMQPVTGARHPGRPGTARKQPDTARGRMDGHTFRDNATREHHARDTLTGCQLPPPKHPALAHSSPLHRSTVPLGSHAGLCHRARGTAALQASREAQAAATCLDQGQHPGPSTGQTHHGACAERFQAAESDVLQIIAVLARSGCHTAAPGPSHRCTSPKPLAAVALSSAPSPALTAELTTGLLPTAPEGCCQPLQKAAGHCSRVLPVPNCSRMLLPTALWRRLLPTAPEGCCQALESAATNCSTVLLRTEHLTDSRLMNGLRPICCAVMLPVRCPTLAILHTRADQDQAQNGAGGRCRAHA